MGFSRQEYWSGCHALLLGIFPTQGWNLALLHCRWILHHLHHQASPTTSLGCCKNWMQMRWYKSSNTPKHPLMAAVTIFMVTVNGRTAWTNQFISVILGFNFLHLRFQYHSCQLWLEPCPKLYLSALRFHTRHCFLHTLPTNTVASWLLPTGCISPMK